MDNPLNLNSPRWFELRHAYGPATDTPDLLRAVRSDPCHKQDCKAEPWFSLWSSLCHQGDVYPASFAAIPHIVRAGLDAKTPCALDVLLLPSAVETARIRKKTSVPSDLADAYRKAIEALPLLVACQARHEWDEMFTRAAAAAIAACKGQADLAEAIGDLDPETLADFLADHERGPCDEL